MLYLLHLKHVKGKFLISNSSNFWSNSLWHANNSGENKVHVLIGNVWEAINYAMFEGKQKIERQNIPKTIGHVGK